LVTISTDQMMIIWEATNGAYINREDIEE